MQIVQLLLGLALLGVLVLLAGFFIAEVQKRVMEVVR